MNDKIEFSELIVDNSTTLMDAMRKMDEIGRKLLMFLDGHKFVSLIS